MMEGVESLRKKLTSNTDADINIYALHDEEDLEENLTRSDYSELIKDFLKKFEEFLIQSKKEMDEQKITFDVIELVGEASRMPILQEFIKMWRNHFLEHNDAKHLPKGWRVDHKIERDFGS